MANVEIIPIPIGSQFVQNIGRNDPDDLNDFPCLLVFDENVTGLTQSGVSVSSGSSIVSVEGEGSVWRVWVRPPQRTGIVTLTIARNAVNEGNPETSKAIRVSTSFPDADAEDLTLLFSHGLTGNSRTGIAVTPQHILILQTQTNFRYSTGRMTLTSFTHAGVAVSGGSINSRAVTTGVRTLDFINGDILVGGTLSPYRSDQAKRYNLSFESQELPGIQIAQVTHTRLGITGIQENHKIRVYPYGDATPIDFDVPGGIASQSVSKIAHQGDLLYVSNSANLNLLEINTADEIRFLKQINVDTTAPDSIKDSSIYGDTLFTLHNDHVRTLDIRKYRPTAKNTKTRIDVQIVSEGDTIPLKQFCPDAERIVPDVGFDKPSFLSINANSELTVGSVSNDSTVLVKLKGINRIDATADGSFQFYLVILKDTAPRWRDVAELTMPAGSTYNLFQLVDADAIEFRSGRTRLAGSRLSNGVFTVGNVGGIAEFTAQKNGRSSHIAININLISSETATTEATGYRVEIMGINVTADVLEFPSVSETLDPVIINEYVVNQASVLLENDNGKYNPDLAGNFWAENGLNRGGFENGVKIYTEHVDGSRNLLFAGRIIESFEPFSEGTFQLDCADVSSLLRNARVQNFGTLEKWDVLRRQSDEENFEGVYVPDRALPIQPETVAVWADRTELTLSRLELPSEGPVQENTAYASRSDVRTAGGYLPENPIAQFKTQHRSEDIRFLVNQLAVNKGVYNVQLDIPGITLDDPFILNRGSVPFSVENTRVMRLPVDWVHDPSNRRILILLSNPEGHVADRLVQYDLNSDAHRVLYEFDKDVVVHRIVRRNSTNYYILTAKPITQDRSARTLPRSIDSTRYNYDSAAEGSEIKIWHIGLGNPTATLTEHVAADDARPPQLAAHYWVGFENSLYIDEFEGIRPNPYTAFKVYGSHLYYRYATNSEFGVARVDTSGTTAEMIDQAKGAYWNHVNFAFDLNTSGDIFFVYATGSASNSSLIVKRRTAAGVESTLLTDTKALSALTVLDDTGGAYLGALECLIYGTYLYIIAPIQRVDEDSGTYTRSRAKGAGCVLYRVNVNAGSPTLEVIEKYDFVQLGPCALTVHDGAVHYVEHPPVGTRFKPINPDLPGYYTDAENKNTMGYNLLPENQGQLKRVSSSGAVESLGNLWYTDRPYSVAVTRCLSIDGDLHLTMGYGNLDEVLRFNSLASAADNAAHLVYGRTLHYVLPEFDPQGSVYEALADIAKKVNATLSFEKNIVMITDRSPYRAKTDGATGTGTGNLGFENANKPFPSSGYLLIGKEILAYTGIRYNPPNPPYQGGTFTGITRGVLGSAIVDHPDGSDILYLDTLIRSSDMKEVTLQSDTNRIFNVIRDAGGIAEVRDAASIAKYGERPYTLNLGFTRHEKAWTERILQSYLEEFKDLQQLVNLQTVPDTRLKLGQIVPFFYEGLLYGMRIVGDRYEDEATHIKGRTV